MKKYWYHEIARLKAWMSEDEPDGFCGNGCQGPYYLASDADTRIAELERLLDVERRALAAEKEYSDKAKAWEAEANEQARLNGMGGEREAKLMARIAELELALVPFGKPFEGCEELREFVTKLRGNPVDGVTAYIWWAARHLCIDDFKQARRALGIGE